MDEAMYNNFFRVMLLVKKDCVRYLKNNYIVRKEFWTEKYGDHIKVGSLDKPTIIALHKEKEQLIYEYMFQDAFGKKTLVQTTVHPSLVDLIPDGFMEKSIEVIKAYCRRRIGTSYPEVTLISGDRYRIMMSEEHKQVVTIQNNLLT